MLLVQLQTVLQQAVQQVLLLLLALVVCLEVAGASTLVALLLLTVLQA
jgi:hypothetical protein